MNDTLAKSATLETVTFESALQELEGIVASLERGEAVAGVVEREDGDGAGSEGGVWEEGTGREFLSQTFLSPRWLHAVVQNKHAINVKARCHVRDELVGRRRERAVAIEKLRRHEARRRSGLAQWLHARHVSRQAHQRVVGAQAEVRAQQCLHGAERRARRHLEFLRLQNGRASRVPKVHDHLAVLDRLSGGRHPDASGAARAMTRGTRA